MSGLRVFVSSTCYDLSVIRSQLRVLIQSLGHDPVMSDYSDILYDPRAHTHTSCVDEVTTTDIVVLVVGSRFGGKVVPEALGRIDFDRLGKESKNIESLKKKENLSVTQLEILKAIESGIPVFTFIEANVWHDHALYEKNKDKSIINEISFPSIEKEETATFIFEFINFLRHRVRGNNVFSFSKIQDIEEILKKHLSSLFQKLLQEERSRSAEAKRIDNLTEQFEDLKTAILTSIGTTNEKEVARGVVRFRRLLDLIWGLGLQDNKLLVKDNYSWNELLDYVEIERVVDINELSDHYLYHQRGSIPFRLRPILVKKDGTFYEYRGSSEVFNNLPLEWDAFMQLPEKTREIIVDALVDMRQPMGPLRYIRESLDNYINKQIDIRRTNQEEIKLEEHDNKY